MWDEEDHPRGQPDNAGQFVEKEQTSKRGYNSQNDLNNLPVNKKAITLSKQEYAVLRKEVMRKNSAQNGKAKRFNSAFTANYFYVYSTSGGDSFKPLVQLDIEKHRDEINYWLKKLGE